MIDLSVRYREPPKGGRNLKKPFLRSRAGIVAIALLLGLVGCRDSSHGSEGGEVVRGRPSRDIPSADTAHDPAVTATTQGQSAKKVQRFSIKVLAVYPHDPGAFTQGLVWDGGVFYESTGLYGKSSLRRADPGSGRVQELRAVDPNLFGEGLAQVGDRLLQLTWHAGIVLVYDLASLDLVDEYGFNGQGWGLAYDGTRLVMSDGSHRLTFRDPEDFRWLSTLEVTMAGRPVRNINELEFAEGLLYANIWGEERIVRIDPDTGEVDGVIDASNLLSQDEKSRVDVLNGIAYDPVSKTFWLTGKFWPKMFQVEFHPAGG